MGGARGLDGLDGRSYIVASSNGMNLLSYQQTYPKKQHLFSLYQTDFVMKME
jgi:hypothetical protein